MKILYFSFVELDVPNACQTHTLGVLRGFSRNGCQVDALVPRPLYIRPNISNVTFYYLWPWRFSLLGRAWIKFLCGLVMFYLCLKNRYDAIYVREMEANPSPQWCSRFFRVPLYMEINDLTIPVLKEDGVSRRLLKRVERNQKLDFLHSSGLVVPSVPMCSWIIDRYGLPEYKVHMILNGTEVTHINQPDRISIKEALGLPVSSFCIGFLGNIYERYDFNSMLQALLKCQDSIPDLYFIIVGDGPLAVELKRKVSKLDLDQKVIFSGYIQPKKFDQILPVIDLGLLLLTQENVSRYGPVTTKLSTYGIFGMPVITAGISLEGYPEELEEALLLVPPEDPQALADMILWLYRHPEERKEKAQILHDFVIKKLTWEEVTSTIIGIINNDKKQMMD